MIAKEIHDLLEVWYEDGRNDPIVFEIKGEKKQIFLKEKNYGNENEVVIRTLPADHNWEIEGYPPESKFIDITYDANDQEVKAILKHIEKQ